MFLMAIMIAMSVNTLWSIPLYNRFQDWTSKRGRIIGKLFNCIFCTTFWICVIIGAINAHDMKDWQWVLVTLSSPYLADLLKRLRDALPIKI